MLSKIAITALVTGAAFAQTSPAPQWVALDSTKPGTPAELRVDRANSDANRTTVQILIHGFYLEPKQGPDGMYHKITVPGLGATTQTGAPELPVARFKLAVVTGARAVRLGAVKQNVTPRTYNQIMAWPKVIGERDHETPLPEQFRRDDAIYKGTAVWPAADGLASSPVRTMLGNIAGATEEVYPVRWNPSTRTLSVVPSSTAVFEHTGTPSSIPLTRHRARMASNTFLNYDVIAGGLAINYLFYEGDFLFIYPNGYKDELQPLIDQKQARGFLTSEQPTTTTGNTCAGIRAAIQTWYNSRPVNRDKYALLVGDTNQIPLCTAPGTGDPTDDLYGSVNGDDLDEEVYVGRLSVDSEADLANQVGKILTYEDSPSLFCCYDKALLVAHKEQAPGKYVGAHESVRTASYAVPPVFSTLYGHIAGVDDADVSLAINNGLGLVAYRGHGSSGAWTTWNTGNESYNSTDVLGLANLAAQVPVVWSLACTNSALGTEDSIGEIWMEDSNNRAASFYGSTVASYTSQNHELDRQLFKAVYDTGLTIQSHAIKQAEEQMATIMGSEDNAWMYLLLGDPEMTIRRRNPINWKITVPAEYKPCYGPGCFLNVTVLDEIGNPAPFVKVAAWKTSTADRFKNEIQSNRYTDKYGRAQIPVSGVTAGKLVVTLTDDAGNNATRTVVVR